MQQISKPAKIRGCAAINFIRIVFIASVAGVLAAGCTRAELENRASDYNNAIAESNNEAILLNAVRASQYAPMSFTSMGDGSMKPNFSGSTGGTFNLDPFGLKTYSLSPTVSASGGFSTFTLGNSNTTNFMKSIRDSIDPKLVIYFRELNWPVEVMTHMAVHSYDVSREELAKIERDSDRICARPPDEWKEALCILIAKGKADRADCYRYSESRIVTVLNTGRSRCGMAKFQIMSRRLMVLDIGLGKFSTRYRLKLRSAHGMLYYLGELIAAQNYSVQPYTPQVLVGGPGGPTMVDLFVVQRGNPAPMEAAVRTWYHGEQFYIPRPALGAWEEARSLQVLDFVSHVIAAQTSAKELPRSPPLVQIQ